MSNESKAQQFLADFDRYKKDSASFVRGKLKKYRNQRMDFNIPSKIQSWLELDEKENPVSYRPTMRFSLVYRSIFKMPAYLGKNTEPEWTIVVDCVRIVDGETSVVTVGRLSLGFHPSDLLEVGGVGLRK